jgi:antitoxin component YwqK of YwqJK toxin-antitoxin module
MKKILFLIITVLSVNICISQTIIENPSFNKTTHKDLKIEKITIDDNKTIVDFFIYADEGWFCVENSYYIKGKTDEKTYKLLKSEGMSICPKNYEFNHDSVRFSLHFQPIDTINDYIDIIEGCDNSCVTIENILIDNGIADINNAYSKANNYYHQKNYTKAIEIAKNGLQLVKDTNGLRYGQLSLIIGDSYLWSKDYDNAEIWYQRILNSNLVDSTETGNFAYPFANFKNKACQGMAYVYEYKGDWMKSLEWLEKEKSYPFYTYGNTHRLKHAIHILEWYVFLYEKMEKYDKAVYENLTFIINYFGSGVREQLYMKTNQRLVNLIASHYDNSKFISQLDSALENMIVTENEDLVISEFNFLNQKYKIKVGKNQKDFKTDKEYRLITGSENKTKDKDYFINRVKNQLFYDRAQLVIGQSLYKNGDLIFYKGQPYTGKFYEFWVNGNVRTEGELKEGVFNGDFTFYYENGIVKETGSMIEGSYHGLWKTYYDNGAIESEGAYNQGKRNDKWIFWYPSGKQNMPLSFTGGDLAGFSMTAQSDEDIPKQKKAEINYTNDVEDGLITIWFENGQKFREGRYENGKRFGKWIEWNKDGDVVKSAKYKDGNLIKGDSFDNE